MYKYYSGRYGYYGYSRRGPRKGFRSPKGTVMTVILAAAIMVGLMTPAEAHAYQKGNSSETNPTPTTEVTRNDRKSTSQQRLRGEGEWTWVNYGDEEYLGGFRMDMESPRTAEYTVDMFASPRAIENNLELDYEDSFRVRGLGYCEGVELYDPESGMTLYAITCADGRYVNFMLGTNKNDVLDAMTDMQDGYVPEPVDYVEAD